MLGKRANAIAQVAQQRVDPRQTAPFANGLPRLLCATQANQRPPSRFIGAESGPHAIVRVHRDVALQLLLKLILSSPTTQQAKPQCS
jgi:hypothetical protein